MQSNTKSHLALRALIEGAIMIALAWALDALVPPFYRFPAGGSVDLAMIPILVYCLRWGPKWSALVCVTNGVLQFFLGGGLAISVQSMLLDYILAYALVFVCGFAAGKKLGWLWGTAIATAARFVPMWLAGAVIWGEYMPESFLGLAMVNPWVYSAIYNGLLSVLVMTVDLIVLGIFQAVPAIEKNVLQKQN